MFSEENIKKRLIKNLVVWRKWGASHTENIFNGLPKHIRGHRVTKKVLKELIKNEWLLPAIKTGETHYSLNPRKIDEIMEYYEERCKDN